jgi:hypothetical protein
LAPKRIHTRRNPDPEVAIPVSDPEKIVHKRKEKAISLVLCLDMYLSFPKYGVTSIEYLDFDVKFEKTLFRTKSESCLSEIIFDEKRINVFILVASAKLVVIHTQNQQPLQILTATMEARFSPLVLHARLYDFPWKYNISIKLYDVEGSVLAQTHLDGFNDFIELEKLDFKDVKMRLFSRSLAG